jgi:1,2-phenylacetyl-CoA epoxidase PaaB subunit
MARWRVDYIGKGGKHLGTVEAPDEKSAISEAMNTFNITPARRFKIVVTKIDPARK